MLNINCNLSRNTGVKKGRTLLTVQDVYLSSDVHRIATISNVKSLYKGKKCVFSGALIPLPSTSRYPLKAAEWLLLIIVWQTNDQILGPGPQSTTAPFVRQYLLSITGRQLQNRTFNVPYEHVFIKQSLVCLPKLIIQCPNKDTVLTDLLKSVASHPLSSVTQQTGAELEHVYVRKSKC